MENQNEIALEKLKKSNVENSLTLFNLLFTGGLLAVFFVLFIVFGGNENGNFSGLNGLSAKTFLSGEFSAHITEKFTPKSDFKNKAVFAKQTVRFCFGVKNKIKPLSSGNFSTENNGLSGQSSGNFRGDSPSGVREEKKIEQGETSKISQSQKPKETSKKDKEKSTHSTQSTPTALTRPSETRETYWWEAPEETTPQKDITVTMPPQTNNKPPA